MSARRCSARIDPRKAAGKVVEGRSSTRWPAIPAVLEDAIAAGGSTLRDFAQPDGELGYFSKHFDVYDREGEPCGCGGTVKRIVQGGRSTFFCPRASGNLLDPGRRGAASRSG